MKTFFVFAGQGAQTVGMGFDLYEKSAAARKIFDTADQVLNRKLSEVCFNGPIEKLTESRNCQTAIYTMSCAALEAFREKFPQVKPIGCAGLSLGEYGALYGAGAFSFVDGLMLLDQRAALMDECCAKHEGGMASVLGGDRLIIEEVCNECGIDVANYNSPGQIVISGEKSKLGLAVEKLKERGMRKVIVLNVAGAFHSRLMQEAGDGMATVLAGARIANVEIPVFQNYGAAMAKDAEEIKMRLAKQVSGSVQWEQCVRNLADAGGEMMVEFGPGAVLTGLLRRTLPDMPTANINTFESIEKFSF